MLDTGIRARHARLMGFGSVSTLALALALAALAPHAAQAQARDAVTAAAAPRAGEDIEELVVTARKRSERLRDVPTAASAFGADEIRDMGGLPNAQALLNNVPGVNFANTSNALTSDISIRGSGTSRATNAEAGVGIFVNGAFIGGGNVAGRTFSGIDLFDSERVEVLRGVQGGLGGRNAEGGSINVITAKPTHKFEGYVFGTLAMHQRHELEAVLNVPINDNWAVRVSLDKMNQERGFYHLYVIDQYADAAKKEYGRFQVNYTNGGFSANAMVERANERVPGLIYQVVTFANANFPLGYYTDKYQSPWNSPSAGKQRLTDGEFTINWDMGWATLSTISNFRDRRGQNQYDGDALSGQFFQALALIPGRVSTAGLNQIKNVADYGIGGDQIDHARIQYHDAHLVGATQGFNWVGGGEYYLLNDTPSGVLTRTPTAANPSQGPIDKSLLRFESYAVYGGLAYNLTDQLNVSGDARYTHDREDFLIHRFDYGTGAPIVTPQFNSTPAPRKKGNFSYTATASYKPMTNQMVYAKVGTAYRAGGFNGNLGDPREAVPIPTTFDNEEETAYEVGYKGNLTSFLYLTLAAYQNHFSNLVIQTDNGCRAVNPACPVAATNYATNLGPAKLYGFEAEATARAQVAGGALRVTVGGSRQGGHVTGGPDKGFKQPQQPKWTETFNINYRHDLWSDASGFININGSGRQGGIQEVNQTTLLHDYGVFNLRGGITWKRYEIDGYINNAGNKSYLVFTAPTAAGDVRRYNLPRNWGLQARYTW